MELIKTLIIDYYSIIAINEEVKKHLRSYDYLEYLLIEIPEHMRK